MVEKLQDYQPGTSLQEDHSDCSRVAQHTLVSGPSGHVEANPIAPAQPAQSVDSTVQSNRSQESVKPESLCLAPRVAIKKQGFSWAVAV